MHGPPPPHDNSDRVLPGVSNTIPPNHGQAGSNEISKTFSGLSLSSSSASLDGIGGITSSGTTTTTCNVASGAATRQWNIN